MRNHSQAFWEICIKWAWKILHKNFMGVQVHFCVENIYGAAFRIFKRFMPTNGFAPPFVGIISFL